MRLRSVNWEWWSFRLDKVTMVMLIGFVCLAGAGCAGQESEDTDSEAVEDQAPAVVETTAPAVEGTETAVPTVEAPPTSETAEAEASEAEASEADVAESEPVETAVPVLDGENLSLSWTFDSGGSINHPPLRSGDSLIVAPREGALTALDPVTGAVRWQYDPPQRIWDRAYASDGQAFLIGTEGGHLVALDSNSGELLWQADLGIEVQHPPFIAGDVIYVPSTFVGPGLDSNPEGKAKVFALDMADGIELWQFESDNYLLQTPFLQGDTLYAGGVFVDPEPVDEGGHTRLYALSAGDGSELWTFESLDGFPKQLYATDEAVAYIAYVDFATGLDAGSGEQLWRRDTGNWVPTLSGEGDTMYFGSANTIVHALNVNDGSVEWQHNIEEGTFNYVLGAPVRVGDDLLFLAQQGDIMALDAQDGTLRWQFPTGITARTGLAVSGNQIFIGDQDGIIYAYSTD